LAKEELRQYVKQDFVKFIAEMIVILSIKEPPHALVVNELFEIAKEKFSEFSIGEMRLAFRLFLVNELEIIEDKDGFAIPIEHYQCFDIKFFTTVLIQYRITRHKQMNHLTILESKRHDVPIMSKTEAEYEWRIAIRKQFEIFKKTGILNCQFPNFQFKEFEDLGLIKLTDEEKKAILPQAKERVLAGKRIRRLNPKDRGELKSLTDFITRIETNTATGEEQQIIKAEARKIAIENYYNSIEKIPV